MTYGFIGLGNMVSAILRGMAKSGKFPAGTVYGYNRSPEKTARLAQETGLMPCVSALETAQKADVIILAVKPQMMEGVLSAIAPAVTEEKLVISIAAGKPTSYYEAALGHVPVVRVMPNINARVLAATTAVCKGAYAGDGHLDKLNSRRFPPSEEPAGRLSICISTRWRAPASRRDCPGHWLRTLPAKRCWAAPNSPKRAGNIPSH